jgi:sensor histidine kinase YesM
MTLQPIVENAISHGLELTPGVGHLLLHAYIENKNTLVVRVVDDGVGIDEEALASITEKLESEDYSFYFDQAYRYRFGKCKFQNKTYTR